MAARFKPEKGDVMVGTIAYRDPIDGHITHSRPFYKPLEEIDPQPARAKKLAEIMEDVDLENLEPIDDDDDCPIPPEERPLLDGIANNLLWYFHRDKFGTTKIPDQT